MSIRSMMNQRGRVERETVTQTATGGVARTWTVTHREIPVRLRPIGAELAIEQQRAGMRVTHKAYTPANVSLTIKDRLIVGGQTYTVRGFTDADHAGRLRVALLEVKT
ncbi:MAG: head-tail adaptor protein [Planctomycetes bacterium]|nr:head-tail adaptor protein [Planctomycetota bacterium]